MTCQFIGLIRCLLEALLADLQSAAPPKQDDASLRHSLKADRSSLAGQEWPAPPPPVDGELADGKEEEEVPQTNGGDKEKEESPKSEDEKPPPVPPLPKEFQQGPTMKPYPSGPTSTSANLAELDNLLEALNTPPYTAEIDSAGELW